MSSTLAGFAPDRLVPTRRARAAVPASAPAFGPALDASLAPALRVPLHDNGPWHESLLIQPVAQPQGRVAIRIESVLDTARRPTEAQVRYRGTLDRDALLRLREAIDVVLGAGVGKGAGNGTGMGMGMSEPLRPR